MTYPAEKTAVILIGYQNDFLSPEGALNSVIKDNVEEVDLLKNTRHLIDNLKNTDIHLVVTPILFSEDYSELHDPSGLMETIKNVGAFRREAWGGEIHKDILDYGDRILQLTGKTRFNGFYGTELQAFLNEREIEHLVFAGVITSLCVDSTARAATDLGYSVTVLSDATAARNMDEQHFYCESIFPLYANLETTESFLAKVEAVTVA